MTNAFSNARAFVFLVLMNCVYSWSYYLVGSKISLNQSLYWSSLVLVLVFLISSTSFMLQRPSQCAFKQKESSKRKDLICVEVNTPFAVVIKTFTRILSVFFLFFVYCKKKRRQTERSWPSEKKERTWTAFIEDKFWLEKKILFGLNLIW